MRKRIENYREVNVGLEDNDGTIIHENERGCYLNIS